MKDGIGITVNPDSDEVDSQDAAIPASIGESIFNRKTLVSFAIAILIVGFLFYRTDIDFKESLARVRGANPILMIAALLSFYGTLVLRGWRWNYMLATAGVSRAAGYDVPDTVGTSEIITLSWFANSILPARLGDAYRCYLMKRKSGASFGLALGTVFAERLIDLIVLVAVLLLSGLVVYGSHAPDKTQHAFMLGALVVVIGVVGLAVLWLVRDHIERFMPAPIALHYRTVRAGLFDSLVRPLIPVLVSICIWMFDGLRLFLVTMAIGHQIAYPEAVMIALLSALVSTVPITPAGLGFVEGTMIYALTTVDIGNNSAAAIAVLDRIVTYGSLMLVGGALYLWMMRRDMKTAKVKHR